MKIRPDSQVGKEIVKKLKEIALRKEHAYDVMIAHPNQSKERKIKRKSKKINGKKRLKTLYSIIMLRLKAFYVNLLEMRKIGNF